MIKLITAPTTEPISLTEAKLHLKVDNSDDDTLISSLIKAARQSAENFTNRALSSQVLELILDDFPEKEIVLPRPPVETLTSIKYTNCEGVESTLDSHDYISFIEAEPAVIVPAYGKSFPYFTPYPKGAVKIRYTAGYKTSGTEARLIIPEAIKQALLLIIGSYYENREDLLSKGHILKSLPFGAEYLLYQFRIWSL